MTGWRLIFSDHAVRRMFERGITVEAVTSVAERGDVLEEYPNDTPYPSRLQVGAWGGHFIHVVLARNAAGRADVVVTVYEPSADHWLPPDFRRRTSK